MLGARIADGALMGNRLYYGDNLDILQRYVKDESVDLVYLDPPFNSNATYNVLFAEQDGSRAASQIKAFGDTWQWDQSAAAAYESVVEAGGRVAEALIAFRTFLGETNMLAGLIRDDEMHSLDGLPGLSDLPVIGHLFAHNTKSTTQTDIILTLTPHPKANRKHLSALRSDGKPLSEDAYGWSIWW